MTPRSPHLIWWAIVLAAMAIAAYARADPPTPRERIDALERAASDLTSSTTSDRIKVGAGDDLVLELRATWNLSRVVFDPAELRASREGARLARERMELESEVTRLYYQRKRLEIDWILEPPRDTADEALRRMQIEELTATLDAMTDGFFSREQERLGRSGAR
jgi:hypothetical protein